MLKKIAGTEAIGIQLQFEQKSPLEQSVTGTVVNAAPVNRSRYNAMPANRTGRRAYVRFGRGGGSKSKAHGGYQSPVNKRPDYTSHLSHQTEGLVQMSFVLFEKESTSMCVVCRAKSNIMTSGKTSFGFMDHP